MTIEIRKPYTRIREATVNEEPSLTKQSFKKECDVNNIMAKFIRTGTLDFVRTYEGQYGSIDPIDYHEAQNIIAKAGQMFDAMPSNLRVQFHNDPAEFLAFVQDPKNADKMVEMKLLHPRKHPPKPPEAAKPAGEVVPQPKAD